MAFGFQKRSGAAMHRLEELQKLRELKRAKLDIRSRRRQNLDRLVIGIGQVHPVLTGRYNFWQARQIAKVQGWIFELCQILLQKYKVHSFGEEGYSEDGAGVFRSRLHPSILSEFRKVIHEHKLTESFLLDTAQDWRRALKRGNQKEVQRTHTALNALTLLQATHDRVTVFPIEQKDVHGRIGEALKHLQQQIAAVEETGAFQRARSKQGKKLTKEEYDAASKRNVLIKEFNRILNDPERERSILREVLEHADNVPITVFLLGNAHKKRFLKLAKAHVPDDVAFVWVTPPALSAWQKRYMRKAAVVIVLFMMTFLYLT